MVWINPTIVLKSVETSIGGGLEGWILIMTQCGVEGEITGGRALCYSTVVHQPAVDSPRAARSMSCFTATAKQENAQMAKTTTVTTSCFCIIFATIGLFSIPDLNNQF